MYGENGLTGVMLKITSMGVKKKSAPKKKIEENQDFKAMLKTPYKYFFISCNQFKKIILYLLKLTKNKNK